MMNSTVKNRRVDRISLLLQEYNIDKIIHIKGQHNCLADYLSRHPIENGEEMFDGDYGISRQAGRELLSKGHIPEGNPTLVGAVVTRSKTKESKGQQAQEPKQKESQVVMEDSPVKHVSHPEIQETDLDMIRMKAEQEKDPFIQQKIEETKKLNGCQYLFQDGLLYKLVAMRMNSKTKTKVICAPSSMISELLQAYHSHPLSGHFGVQRTYMKVKRRFWWPQMQESIQQFIQSCLLCQQFNISRTKKPGYLQPIPTPEGPFQIIGIDYCGPFKRTPRGDRKSVV